MSRKANPANLGKKINMSHLVWQVTKLIYEGVPDMQVARILNDRYSFKVSVPNIAGFRVNFYERRLAELKRDSEEFQSKQTGRIKSFIDESLAQAKAIKDDINSMNRQVTFLEKELSFSSKFDKVFQNAFDKYVEHYSPQNPTRFLESASSPEERKLAEIMENIGPEGHLTLANYCQARAPHGLVRLLAILRARILDQRNALVKIHRDIFKGYKNFSIMQELTMVFEKYNGLIIEEFFPEKKTMDRAKYFRVRKRILALFDELQIRYQGVEAPTADRQDAPSPEQAAELSNRIETDQSVVDDKSKEKVKPPKSGMSGRRPSKYRQAQNEKELDRQEAARKKKEEPKAQDTDSIVEAETLTEDEAMAIMEEAEASSQARKKAGNMDNMFASILDSASDLGEDVLSDLDGKAEQKHGENVSRET